MRPAFSSHSMAVLYVEALADGVISLYLNFLFSLESIDGIVFHTSAIFIASAGEEYFEKSF